MRQQANWMSIYVSMKTGERVTPAQLLGEEEEETQQRLAEAEEAMKNLPTLAVPVG